MPTHTRRKSHIGKSAPVEVGEVAREHVVAAALRATITYANDVGELARLALAAGGGAIKAGEAAGLVDRLELIIDDFDAWRERESEGIDP